MTVLLYLLLVAMAQLARLLLFQTMRRYETTPRRVIIIIIIRQNARARPALEIMMG